APGEADDALAVDPAAGAPAFADACVGALLVADGPASQAASVRASMAAPIEKTTFIFIPQPIAHSAREQRKNNFRSLSSPDFAIRASGLFREGADLSQRRVLLIVGGGIAAYKALELARLLRKADIAVRPILTRAGQEFVTPLSLAALCEDRVYSELFSLIDEAQMGHIELSRSADLVVVAPATADLIAKAANGLAGDLAATTLLAPDKPVLMAPAMNVRMWLHAATQRNPAPLKADGGALVGPGDGA